MFFHKTHVRFFICFWYVGGFHIIITLRHVCIISFFLGFFVLLFVSDFEDNLSLCDISFHTGSMLTWTNIFFHFCVENVEVSFHALSIFKLADWYIHVFIHFYIFDLFYFEFKAFLLFVNFFIFRQSFKLKLIFLQILK